MVWVRNDVCSISWRYPMDIDLFPQFCQWRTFYGKGIVIVSLADMWAGFNFLIWSLYVPGAFCFCKTAPRLGASRGCSTVSGWRGTEQSLLPFGSCYEEALPASDVRMFPENRHAGRRGLFEHSGPSFQKASLFHKPSSLSKQYLWWCDGHNLARWDWICGAWVLRELTCSVDLCQIDKLQSSELPCGYKGKATKSANQATLRLEASQKKAETKERCENWWGSQKATRSTRSSQFGTGSHQSFNHGARSWNSFWSSWFRFRIGFLFQFQFIKQWRVRFRRHWRWWSKRGGFGRVSCTGTSRARRIVFQSWACCIFLQQCSFIILTCAWPSFYFQVLLQQELGAGGNRHSSISKASNMPAVLAKDRSWTTPVRICF